MTGMRLGIIGAGNLSSKRIYPCLHYLPVRLAAVCDLNRELAERNAAKFGGESVYTDHRKMLAEAQLDAVVVCVGPDAHASLAMEIMRQPCLSFRLERESRRQGVAMRPPSGRRMISDDVMQRIFI